MWLVGGGDILQLSWPSFSGKKMHQGRKGSRSWHPGWTLAASQDGKDNSVLPRGAFLRRWLRRRKRSVMRGFTVGMVGGSERVKCGAWRIGTCASTSLQAHPEDPRTHTLQRSTGPFISTDGAACFWPACKQIPTDSPQLFVSIVFPQISPGGRSHAGNTDSSNRM